ncbi:MAG TPA: serine/threonine-protein kinase, partial [Phototrophicaceae bacterium]|nr:serine/threonine-protein kinase [Phototrophicaceae bacterium]
MTTELMLASKRYRVGEVIGAGGMGSVYHCDDRLTGQVVALKSVNLERAGSINSESLRLAITREFETLATLHHPHVVEVIDYGFDTAQQPYFTMAYLDHAQPLDEAARSMPLAGRVELLIQILQALAYLHRRGVIHHDLKPHNVLVDAQGKVKVLDFGVALLRTNQSRQRSTGTLAYMAPEILQGRPASEVSDLYALGVLAYELIAGLHPFALHDLRRLLFQIVNEAPDLSLLPDEGLRRIIGRLLAKDPAARYQDANTVIQELCQALDLPLPEENAAIRESFLTAAVFIGRQHELERLNEGLEGALRGELSAWLIGGESGVGKSRLLDEIRIQALVKGVQVLRGQAVEGGGLRYQAWRDVLPPLILSSEISDFEASVLSEVVPQIGALIDREVTPAAPLAGRGQHQRLSETICALFQRQTRPIALFLEDLQWTTESRQILQDLLLVAAKLRLFIIGTFRNDEAPHLPEQLAQMQLIGLERLSSGEIAELSYGMIG